MKQMGRLAILDALLDLLNVIFDVAVGDKNIGPAIQIVVEKETRKTQAQKTGMTNL